ncbi:serine/threonine-protein kinase ULK3 isoform X2 [Cimex lectularius]|nr:serine/threonine-protein kinase ULK3 isoform X2 [Cimex lectularius]
MKEVLHNEYIVEMKDFQWDEKYIYIILEFCDGGDLSQFIQKRQRLPEKVCKRFMQQLALGLEFLRSKNVCHFDLKPSNLLLVTKPNLKLKIADFGFADFLSEETLKWTLRGSPLYMAPEILIYRYFNEKSDLWSVGIIMYECLLGSAPFVTLTCKQLIIDIKNQVPIEVRPGLLSSDCEDLLRRLLTYDHEKRISYEQFFKHPFIDLKHFPHQESYLIAVKLAREAVKLDYEKKYMDAFNKYCEVLKYLLPFLNEFNVVKREQIRLKIFEYTKRADALKVILYRAKEAFVARPNTNDESAEKDLAQGDNPLMDVRYLKTLCSSTPKMLDGIDIGYAAQMYLFEGKYEIALEKLKACFAILIPLLDEEPQGVRKKLLTMQLDEWMKEAESITSLIDANEAVHDVQNDICSIQ